MGRYSGILLCSDLDGTLYNGEEIPENNIKAIRHFCANGGSFSPASGRPLKFLKERFEDIGIFAPVIALNGAFVYDVANDTEIKRTYMEGLDREFLLKIAENMPYITRINIHTNGGHLKLRIDELQDFDESIFKETFKVTFNLERIKELSDTAKATLINISEDRFHVTRSTYSCIELVDPRNTKEKATRLVADYIGAEKLVCVGDFENDITMVRDADIGYAVANATDALKAVADRITVSVNEGAIAAIIEEL